MEDLVENILNLNAKTIFYVSTSGNPDASGTSQETALDSIQRALLLAQPGDQINILDGTYNENVKTYRQGTEDKPIRIIGGPKAIVKSAVPRARVFEINHSYIHLEGFTIDGLMGTDANSASSYADKLLYITSQTAGSYISNIKVSYMTFKNAGGECIRLRYLVEDTEISYNRISTCGLYDYRFNKGGKNGEGVYVGTAPEQQSDGRNPDNQDDNSRYNWIHHNAINTQGNECVDIKENSTFNLVEANDCTGQLDPESGGIDVRGSHNRIIGNIIYDVAGAGVRLGGDNEDDGIHNDVVGNQFKGKLNAVIKIIRLPQGQICENSVENATARLIQGEDEIIANLKSPIDSCN